MDPQTAQTKYYPYRFDPQRSGARDLMYDLVMIQVTLLALLVATLEP